MRSLANAIATLIAGGRVPLGIVDPDLLGAVGARVRLPSELATWSRGISDRGFHLRGPGPARPEQEVAELLGPCHHRQHANSYAKGNQYFCAY
jgi:hypothetical protein